MELGTHIAVVAPPFPLWNLPAGCRAYAQQTGKTVTVQRRYCEGAYDALLKENNREKHNRIVIEQIEKAAKENDVIVLAQGQHALAARPCKTY